MQWDSSARARKWSFRRGAEGLDVRMKASSLVHDVSPLLIESARAGLGITAMPPFSVARELAEGSLVRLLPPILKWAGLSKLNTHPCSFLLVARFIPS